MPLTVQLIETEADFFDLEQAWNDLQERSANATIFTSFAWARVSWNWRRLHARPCILKLYDGQTLVGLAPFCLTKDLLRRKILQHIGMAFPGRCAADYLDVLSAAGYEEAVLRGILGFLKTRRRLWDALDWWQLSDTSPSYESLSRAWEAVGFHALVTKQHICHTIPLPATEQEYLARLSSNTRNTTERKTRKILRECNASFLQVNDPEETDQAISALFRFQETRWSAAEQKRRVRFITFARQVALAMLERGWLDLRVLRVDDTLLAVVWNFRLHGTVYYYLSSFDSSEEWHKYSPGTILLMHTIRQAIADGCHTFDLMRGNYAYKTHLASEPHQNYRARIVHSSLMYRYYQADDLLGMLRSRVRGHLSRGRRILPWLRAVRSSVWPAAKAAALHDGNVSPEPIATEGN